MARYLPAAALLAALLAVTPAWAAPAVTDDDVCSAITKGREYLINQQNPDGSFGKDESARAWNSLLVFTTLGFMCEHPNHEVMSKGLDYALHLGAKDFEACGAGHSGLAAPTRVMGLTFIYRSIGSEKKAVIKNVMKEDLRGMLARQNPDGGWSCGAEKASDLLATTWHIEAIHWANSIGLELPVDPVVKARDFLFAAQKPNGSWGMKADAASPPSEALTFAAAASLGFMVDTLEGNPTAGKMTAWKHAEAALAWLDAGHREAAPIAPESPEGKAHGLWCLERAGLEWGRAWFGFHDGYREGAASLVHSQAPDGSWGGLEETCFALQFLYEGRAPVMIEKLRFEGQWNDRPRDVAKLVDYSGRWG
jgi:hypothetical protein